MSSLILSSFDYYGDMGEYEVSRHRVTPWRHSGMAYVWGLQDAGIADHDTGYSQHFADVYTLANVVTGGYASNLQSAYHEWYATGRILVTLRRKVASVHIAEGTDQAECHWLPWAGSEYVKDWPGMRRPKVVLSLRKS